MAEVRRRYRGWLAALLLDEDPCHTAKSSQRAAEGMTLLWMPKRCPELNPLETLWGQAKDVICANRQYRIIEEQVDRFGAYLTGLSNAAALHSSGVFTMTFWLQRALSKNFRVPA